MGRKPAAETLASNAATIRDELRLHSARDLLTSEDCSVSESAAELGYRSPSNFSRALERVALILIQIPTRLDL